MKKNKRKRSLPQLTHGPAPCLLPARPNRARGLARPHRPSSPAHPRAPTTRPRTAQEPAARPLRASAGGPAPHAQPSSAHMLPLPSLHSQPSTPSLGPARAAQPACARTHPWTWLLARIAPHRALCAVRAPRKPPRCACCRSDPTELPSPSARPPLCRRCIARACPARPSCRLLRAHPGHFAQPLAPMSPMPSSEHLAVPVVVASAR
jgi:hypothetical protein